MNSKKNSSSSLFVGDYKRDTVVLECEKVAEVSNFLWGIIIRIFIKK